MTPGSLRPADSPAEYLTVGWVSSPPLDRALAVLVIAGRFATVCWRNPVIS